MEYFPGGEEQNSTDLDVLIDRSPVQFDGEVGMPVHEVRMVIPKDGRLTLLEVGIDKVRVPVRVGEPPSLMRVTGLIESERAHWEVALLT
ncbi:MAG: hypothetical protein AAF196_02970 [Planctomycetota bacterium]